MRAQIGRSDMMHKAQEELSFVGIHSISSAGGPVMAARTDMVFSSLAARVRRRRRDRADLREASSEALQALSIDRIRRMMGDQAHETTTREQEALALAAEAAEKLVVSKQVLHLHELGQLRGEDALGIAQRAAYTTTPIISRLRPAALLSVDSEAASGQHPAVEKPLPRMPPAPTLALLQSSRLRRLAVKPPPEVDLGPDAAQADRLLRPGGLSGDVATAAAAAAAWMGMSSIPADSSRAVGSVAVRSEPAAGTSQDGATVQSQTRISRIYASVQQRQAREQHAREQMDRSKEHEEHHLGEWPDGNHGNISGGLNDHNQSLDSGEHKDVSMAGHETPGDTVATASVQEVLFVLASLPPQPRKALKRSIRSLGKAGWMPGMPLPMGATPPEQSVDASVWEGLSLGVRRALGGGEQHREQGAISDERQSKRPRIE